MQSHHTPNRRCETCGNPFHAFACRIKKGQARFCSYACKWITKTDPASRFWQKVDKHGPDECWPYTGASGSTGYGMFWLDGKNVHANRAAWLLTNGPIPDGINVLHECDNPPCVNPVHLFLGTDMDNVHD